MMPEIADRCSARDILDSSLFRPRQREAAEVLATSSNEYWALWLYLVGAMAVAQLGPTAVRARTMWG
eukprot:1456691-Rhodomonas_salina.1